jgi:signal peptidase I
MPSIEANRFYYIGKKYNKVDMLKREDVVRFYYADEPDKLRPGRIIALPGETLEIKDNEFFINGRKEDLSFSSVGQAPEETGLASVTIPENMFYILPDNRENMSFSEKKHFVHIHQIKGKFLESFFKGDSF